MKKGRLNVFIMLIFLLIILNSSFILALCGDNVLDGREECDLGDITNGDGCSSTCQMENGWYCFLEPLKCKSQCGDVVLASNEQCDDGNTLNGDGCNNQCITETGYICGNVNNTKSACNDGIDNDGDGNIDLNDVGCINMYDAIEKEDSIYVSLSGNDNGLGTKDNPFRTLEKARETTRQKIASGLNSDLVIVIRGGEYILNDVFELNENDSGNNEHFVIWRSYPGEEVKITTAEILDNTKWENWNNGIYRMPLENGRNFHTLIEGDKRAYIAQEPDMNLDLEDQEQTYFLTDGQRMLDEDYFSFDSFYFRDKDLNPNWDYSHSYVYARHADSFFGVADISSIDFTKKEIKIIGNVGAPFPYKQPFDVNATDFHNGTRNFFLDNRYRVVNSISFLDSPGEFYVDTDKDYLYYMPFDSNFKTKKIHAPKKDYLFSLNGSNSNPIKNIQINGLGLLYTDYSRTTWTQIDASWYTYGSSIYLENANNILITNNRINFAGSNAIEARKINNILISGNILDEIGSYGIIIKDSPTKNTISDNKLYRIGTIHHNAIGIYEEGINYKGEGNKVLYNTLSEISEDAILMSNKDAIISHNDISDFTKFSSDGGAILKVVTIVNNKTDETLSNMQKTLYQVIDNNYIHDYHPGLYNRTPVFGIYYDHGGLRGSLIRNNIIKPPDKWFVSPFGRNPASMRLIGDHNYLTNNIFPSEVDTERLQVEGCITVPCNNTVSRNIFLKYTDGDQIVYFLTKGIAQNWINSRYNLIVNKNGNAIYSSYDPQPNTWSGWTSAGNDKNSLVINNPVFIDPANGDYRIRPDARDFTNSIGFKDIDMNFGVRSVDKQHGDSICVVKCGYGDLKDTSKCVTITTNNDDSSNYDFGGDGSDSFVTNPASTEDIPANNGTDSGRIFIDSFSPNEYDLNISSGNNKTFFINLKRNDFDRIEWYLNNRLVKENSVSYNVEGDKLYTGNNTLEVVVIKGTYQESKVWNIGSTNNYAQLEYAFNPAANILTYFIIFLILAIIIVIIFLLVNRRNSYY